MKKPHAASPTREDIYIGQRIREARIAIKMSQQDLAELIGVSYQQVQKYEGGINRVNGARIQLLLTALNRPFAYLFPNATDIRAQADPVYSQTLASKDGQALMRALSQITVPRRRRMLLEQAQEYVAMEKEHG